MDIAIGELSRRTGVKVPTIRYYEQVGLMPVPPRTAGSQRRYSSAEVSRLNFIRHSRELGFEVDAIRELLTMNAHPDRSCADVDRIARRHLAEVERRIERLAALRGELNRMLSDCGQGRVGECRVIAVLSDHGQCDDDGHRGEPHARLL
ncbi:MerR family transcriptional regulator [Methylobacterium brachythecii]|uniref:DNA-binding transcriptional MerR regulator n=1 Tax=Methylobacterium brachythecii TaxID=1176177 RepID=A0A7W6ARF9_9HYPH|nr:helix-turn-helix domain-containing protein [Methylobacterium brachythecii]MBB3905326.1 DNA-binding transcriptional MerR regulator [Methylobacterium brachythecii]GLS45865.1 MerR family transcriptional regulator [Methylobacterium brachythecii]